MADPNPNPDLLSPTLAPQIASYSPQVPGRPEIEIAQAAHRIRLVNQWAGADSIRLGARILEIGCGQGTATTVLASAVGASGHIDALDPGDPDYGAPFTLSQAQGHIAASPIGGRISWHRATPQEFLASETNKNSSAAVWDVAVLAHCIWYFASPHEVQEILSLLRGRVRRICVAEYALEASERAAWPHVLGVLARAGLEAHKEESNENVRTPLGPASIKEAAGKAGWDCVFESSVVPEPGLLDGSWEVGAVMSDDFVREVDAVISDTKVRSSILLPRDAMVAAVNALNGEEVRTMDVWVATFAPLASS